MLDLFTLRAVQTAIGICVALLFYFGTYRSTRSRFAGYWVLVVVASAVAAGAYLARDTPLQWWANPVGNAFSVLTAAFIWASTRGLRGRRIRAWTIATGPAAALVAGLAGDSGNDMWAGGSVLIGAAVVYLALSAREVWLLHAALRRRAAGEIRSSTQGDGELSIVAILGITATGYALFYAVRLGFYVAVGPESAAFERWVGSVPTAFSVIITLVVVTFGMTTLDQLDRTRRLQETVRRDSLTGLLTRRELFAVAPDVVERAAASDKRAYALMVDMDHFKAINDRHGHAAGDAALRSFGRTCDALISKGDAVGRLGGEEFGALITSASPAEAKKWAESLREQYADASAAAGVAGSTVSVGLTAIRDGESFEDAFARADAALYDAKSAGRDRVSYRSR